MAPDCSRSAARVTVASPTLKAGPLPPMRPRSMTRPVCGGRSSSAAGSSPSWASAASSSASEASAQARIKACRAASAPLPFPVGVVMRGVLAKAHKAFVTAAQAKRVACGLLRSCHEAVACLSSLIARCAQQQQHGELHVERSSNRGGRSRQVVLRRTSGPQGHQLHGRARRDGRPDRRVRVGQVDPDPCDRRADRHRQSEAAQRRPGRVLHRHPRRADAGERPHLAVGHASARPHRRHLPAVQPGAAAVRAHQRVPRAARPDPALARHARRASAAPSSNAPCRRWPASASPSRP